MRLKLKEDPKEWRKAAWLGALGFAGMTTVLRWRHILPTRGWMAALIGLALLSVFAWLRPGWFRGYYRFTSRVGFGITQLLGRIVLAALFVLVVTPFGLVLRLLGKDLLQLKPQRDAKTFWHPAKKSSPLDRMF
ncbi:MAG TPA: hypothetical protein VG754_07860 [Verrucomicrobiae bacterium]|nr:hypothetical protein [Verrucomicrobiae bacterium]